jgi:polyhydroxybutyrate depolymerase
MKPLPIGIGLRRVLLLVSLLVSVPSSAAEPAAPCELTVDGTGFRLDGKPFPYTGVSPAPALSLRAASEGRLKMNPKLHHSIAPVFLALLGCLGGQSFAQDARFQRFDKNNNGKISPEELGAPRLFRAADKDGDGFISPAEFAAAQQNRDRIAPAAVDPKGPFVQTTHSLTVDGRKRSYIVQAPKHHDALLPVVFFFHGGGGRGENMARAGFREMVVREGFLAVYPTGWNNNSNDGRNAARIAAQQEGVDDVKFVRAIVEDIATRHRIDRSRILASGASNGGIFSHYLAAKAADLFAAIAPVIGGLAEPVAPSLKPSHPISLVVVQGDADPLVPIDGGPIARSDRGGRVIPTEEMLTLYLARNGITGKPSEELLPDTDPADGCRTLVRRYPPGEGGVKVEYWRIQGGGHTLPGSRRIATAEKEAHVGKTSRDYDGLEVIWNFFRSCPPRKIEAKPQ